MNNANGSNQQTVDISVQEAKMRMTKFYQNLPQLLEVWSPIVGARAYSGMSDSNFDLRFHHFAYSLYYFMMSDVSPMLKSAVSFGDIVEVLAQFVLDSINDHLDVVVDDGTELLLSNFILKLFLLCRNCKWALVEQAFQNLLNDFDKQNSNVRFGSIQKSPPTPHSDE